MFHIDNGNFREGLGLVLSSRSGNNDGGIYLIPITGDDFEYYDPSTLTPKTGYPNVGTYFQTHELSLSTPIKNLFYCSQMEFNFDYIVTGSHPLTLCVEGTDFYGRDFKIKKTVKYPTIERYEHIFLRVDKHVFSVRVWIEGIANYRLTHINMKSYLQSDSVNSVYGMDT